MIVRVLVGLLACNVQSLLAQSPPLPYWQHSQWTGENAPPIPGEHDLGRSADGYLWIGAMNAMIRFDGIRFTVMDSTNTPAFRGVGPGGFYPMSLDSRGTFWIHGPRGSVFTYANGVVKTIFQQESEATGFITEDGAGRLWTTSRGAIRRVENGRLVAPGLPAGVPDTAIFGLQRDTSDGLWIGTESEGLWHVQRNRVEHFGTGRIRALLQSRDGVVWAVGEGLDGGGSDLWQLVAGRWSKVHPPGEPSRSILTRIADEGPDGSVWFVTADMGLLRWHDGRIERFSKDDGLSANRIGDVYADSEGAVWASTDAGLDRLRPSTFMSIEKRNGLPYDHGGLFAEDSSGAIWVSAGRLAYLLDDGIIRNRPGRITSRPVPVSEAASFQLISPSRFGGVWVGPGTGGILRLTSVGQPAHRVRDGFPSKRIGVAFELRDGTVWTSSLVGDLGTFKQGKYKPFPILAADKPVIRGIAEDAFGRTWLASTQHHVTVLVGDSVVSRIVLPERGGDITSLAAEAGDTMWASTHSTLIRIVGARAVEVTPPALERVLAPAASTVVSQGFLWLASIGGFARIPLTELHRAADGGAAVSSVEVFGPLDGLTIAHTPTQVPVIMRVGRDKRVWVTTPNGLAVADPAFRMVTKHPRTVVIEEFAVGDNAMPVRDGERVPPSPDRISFHFTVPSMLLAERVRMQYRLDGADDGWIDATGPRIATYNKLRSGHFVFRVRAWDETGRQIPGEATLAFRVMPTWYQSWWFTVLVVLTVSGALALMYRLRVRQLTHAYNVRLEERWAERTRIARELHDTLLQGFQGLMFHLQAARDMLPAQTSKAMPALDAALQKGETVIDQARTAVGDLRSSERVPRDLDEGLAAIAAEAVHQCRHGEPPVWTIDTKGRIREIPPTVLYEVYQVVKEAICNAFQHARAANVLIEVRYSIDRLRIAVTDDGIGFDETQLSLEQRSEHFGLRGMRERVTRLGGAVTIASHPHDGTRVTLSVPASVAYQKASTAGFVNAIRQWRGQSRKFHHD